MAPRVGRRTIGDMLDIWDHEGNCRAVYREAGIDPAAPEGAHRLAWALLGRRCIRYWKPLLGDGAFTPARGSQPATIWIRPNLDPFREAWVIYHELAERHLYAEQLAPDHERACDELAARLRAPREAFLDLVRDVGLDLPRLAADALCSQTSAALRYSETTSIPIALVSARSVRYRGEEWGWPEEGELRRLAKAKRLPPEVQCVKITDAPRAVLLATA